MAIIKIPASAAITAEDKAVAARAATLEQFRCSIQAHADATAQSRNYDDGNSLASYVASTNKAWAAEAQAFIAWRDQVWVYAYAELAKVEAGERDVLTVEAFIDELPATVWPG